MVSTRRVICLIAVFSIACAFTHPVEQLEGPASPALFKPWLENITAWRSEVLTNISYSDWVYSNVSSLFWTQSSFIQTQMMAMDTYFFDVEAYEYTVDKYLDDLEKRYGGIDAVLIWPTYTNLGIDNRNQFDLARAMPGGTEGLKNMVDAFHARGVNVLLPYNPWDQGTRESPVSDEKMMAKLLADIGADGFNGDTMPTINYTFFNESLNIGHPIALEPEGGGEYSTLSFVKMGWGYWNYQTVPTVDLWKWLERRHMTNICNRWARNHTDDLQHAFFNGCGFESWENVWGIWNQMNLRDSEALRRISSLMRFFKDFLVADDWEPHAPVLQKNIFASKWTLPIAGTNTTLYTLVNRDGTNSTGPQIVVPYSTSYAYLDMYHGNALYPKLDANGSAILNFDIEAGGYGCVLIIPATHILHDLKEFLVTMNEMTSKYLASYSTQNVYLKQSRRSSDKTNPVLGQPNDMVRIPAIFQWKFVVNGIEIEGANMTGVDFQYDILGEEFPKRFHSGAIDIDAFYIDKHPVTNEAFAEFLNKSLYTPRDPSNFLVGWTNGVFPTGSAKKPVTWVGIEDARAYCSFFNKRLPTEWEWQYSAQGNDSRLYPWGNTWNDTFVPKVCTSRDLCGADDVDAHPQGVSPFGVFDLVGNVWQWTDEYMDEHTRAAVIRGGSYYQAQGSKWYFTQNQRLDQHAKYLLIGESYDRAGTLGFRCVADTVQEIA